MRLTVLKGRETVVLEIPAKHAEREIRLPNQPVVWKLGQLDGMTINLTPSTERIGVPATQPDPVRTCDEPRVATRYKAEEPEKVTDMFEEAA